MSRRKAQLQCLILASSILLGSYLATVNCAAVAPLSSDSRTTSRPVNPPCSVIQWTCASVTLFNKCFFNEVRKSPILSNVFDLEKLTQKQEAEGLFYVAGIIMQKKQDNRSPFLANLVVRDLAESKKPLTLDVMAGAYSNGAAKFLNLKGVLDQHNACSMGTKYASTMAQSATRVVDKCVPNSKVAALAIGYEDFMDDMKLFTPENTMLLSLFFSNEFLYQRDFQNPAPVFNAPIEDEPQDVISESIDIPFRADLCDFNPPAIKAFNDVFLRKASESAILRNLFDFQNITVAQFSRGTFHTYQYYLASAYNKGSSSLAQSMASSLSGIQSLPFSLLTEVYSNIAAKFLFSEKRLTLDNSHALAKSYVKALEDATVFIVDSSFIKSKFVALATGFVNYISSFGLFTNAKGGSLAFYFANEWRCHSRKTP